MNAPITHPLIQHLEQLANGNNQQLARLAYLRKGLLDPAKIFPVILPYLGPAVSPKEVDRYALLAALFASHPKSGQNGNFGDHLRLGIKGNFEVIERRFLYLLHVHTDNLPKSLYQSVIFLRSNNINVHWEQLRTDLIAWDDPERSVQKRWAHGFWALPAKKNPEPGETL